MARMKIYASNAERVKACRERANTKALCVQLPIALHARFEEFLKFKDLKKGAVIAKLIETQLLRKR